MPLAEGPIVFLLFGPEFSSERLREKCLHQVGPTHHVPTALIFMEITFRVLHNWHFFEGKYYTLMYNTLPFLSHNPMLFFWSNF